jgi:hypothetical protein
LPANETMLLLEYITSLLWLLMASNPPPPRL